MLHVRGDPKFVDNGDRSEGPLYATATRSPYLICENEKQNDGIHRRQGLACQLPSSSLGSIYIFVCYFKHLP